MKFTIAALAVLLTAVSATPTPTVKEVSKRQESVALCSQYAYHAVNGYEILNNLWGKDAASSGSQCTYFEGTTSNGVKFSTQWQWQGGQDNVKSYIYAGKILTKGQLLSNIKQMPTSIQWNYDTENVRANVAYDIFTAQDPNHVNSSGDYEIMIWLARLGGVWPISAGGSPIAQVTMAGYKFDLYYGLNGSMKVYSFVTSQGSIKSFSADAKIFFDYLVQNHQYPASTQNLIVYQVGTETFTGGPAKWSVSNFNANVS